MATITSTEWVGGNNSPLQSHQLNPNCKYCQTHKNAFTKLYDAAMLKAAERANTFSGLSPLPLPWPVQEQLVRMNQNMQDYIAQSDPSLSQLNIPSGFSQTPILANREAVIPLEGSVLGAQEILAQVPGQVTMFVVNNASLVLIDNTQINGVGTTVVSISPQAGERSLNRFATPLPFTRGLVAIAKRLDRNRSGSVCISYQVYE